MENQLFLRAYRLFRAALARPEGERENFIGAAKDSEAGAAAAKMPKEFQSGEETEVVSAITLPEWALDREGTVVTGWQVDRNWIWAAPAGFTAHCGWLGGDRKRPPFSSWISLPSRKTAFIRRGKCWPISIMMAFVSSSTEELQPEVFPFLVTTGAVRVMDFGVAKLLDLGHAGGERFTKLVAAPLTKAYAAPEHVDGGAVSFATDVYALGALPYEFGDGAPSIVPIRAERRGLAGGALDG
jgi:hypothetical protein